MRVVKTSPSIFAAFDMIRVINLPHRRDRRAQMRRQFEKTLIQGSVRIDYFPAISCADPGPFQSRGAHGCFLSHIAILKEAAETNSAVLILEDDCDFLDAIFDYQDTDKDPWDIFYGGWLQASDPNNLPDSDIIGAHFMGFSARAAKAGVRYFEDYMKADFVGDPRAITEPGYNPEVRPPVDGGYVWLRRAHPELITRFEMISTQRPSRTDIGALKLFDRLPVVRELTEGARRLRHRLAAA